MTGRFIRAGAEALTAEKVARQAAAENGKVRPPEPETQEEPRKRKTNTNTSLNGQLGYAATCEDVIDTDL